MPTVRLPDGRLIKNVPKGISKEELTQKLIKGGVLKGDEDFLPKPEQSQVSQDASSQDLRDKYGIDKRDFGRDVGLGARALVEGAAGVADLPVLAINAFKDDNLEYPSNIVSEKLTQIGLPEPETSGERIASFGISSLGGGGLIRAGAKTLAPKISKYMTSGNKFVDATADATAGFAAGASKELFGDNPLIQIGSGVLGAMAGGGAASKISSLASKSKAVTPNILKDVSRRGVDGTNAINKVKSSLAKESERANKEIKTLFEAAEQQGKNAYVKPEQVGNFVQRLRAQAVEEIDDEARVILSNAADRLDEVINSGDVNVNALEGIRRSASKVARVGGSKGYAGGQVIRDIDDFLDGATIIGDKNAASTWKSAISKRREFAEKFERPKKIAKAIAEDETIEGVEKAFIGTGWGGGQKDLARTYNQVMKATPATDKKEIGLAMRQSVINRMIKDAARAVDDTEGLSASRLSNGIKNLRRENKSMWYKFKKDERKILLSLEKNLKNVPKGGVLSRSYSAVRKLFRSNIELPRTIKDKQLITVDDLIKLTNKNYISGTRTQAAMRSIVKGAPYGLPIITDIAKD